MASDDQPFRRLNELKIKGILFEPRNDKWKWVG